MSRPIDSAYSETGTGPAIFFIHGVGAQRQVWNRIALRLSDQFRCITYDLRGHGESPGKNGPFGLSEFVADLEALRERLGVDRAHVIGHSLGGMIAPAYATAYPARVASLGLLSTAAFRTPADRDKLARFLEVIEKEGVARFLDTLIERWFTDAFRAANFDLVEARKRQVLEIDPLAYLETYRTFATTEIGPMLPAIAAPTLVLTGEFDLGCGPALNRKIADALQRSKLVILDGLRHSILLEAPELVALHLRDFLLQYRDV